MKKIVSLILMFVMSGLSILSCASNTSNPTPHSKTPKDRTMEIKLSDKKILIAFFSHTGENYGVGNIAEGNTHISAQIIAEATGGSLFEIIPEIDYPHNSYDKVVEIAKQEKEKKVRPAIKGDVKVEDYDIIFLGYPNWWGDMPMPVYTFLEKHEWNGKTVVPFCTHEGSGLSNTEKYVADTCHGARVAKGLAVRGEIAQNHREQANKLVKSWLSELEN